MTAVVFVSTDSEQALKAWNNTSELDGGLGSVHVPLVSDCNHKVSTDYGVLIEDEGVAQRASFIIDPKGTVRNISIHDADVGRSVDETQRLLDALAFKDAFGEGCPVNWQKGDKGIRIAEQTRVEAPIEIKKSWSDWARPKLQRTWSGNGSTRSRTTSTPQPPSPLHAPFSPTSTSYMEKNLEAAMTNHNLMVLDAVGVAN